MHATLGTQVLQKAVQLACRAPSVHNSQPWRWVAEGEVLRLFVDRHRTVPGTDRSGREAIISCGAVLDHLRVAMLAAGWDSVIERFPNPNDPDHLASIEFRSVDHVTDAQRNRADAILQRRTDRLPLGRPTYWDLFEPVLRSTIDDSLATLDVLSDDVRPRLAEASQLTEALRRDDVVISRRTRVVDLAVRSDRRCAARARWRPTKNTAASMWDAAFRSEATRIGVPRSRWTGRKSLCCLPRKTPERMC